MVTQTTTKSQCARPDQPACGRAGTTIPPTDHALIHIVRSVAQVNYVAALASRIMGPRRVAPPRFPGGPGAHVDHSPFAELLRRASDGWTVDYGAVRKSPEFIDYVATLAATDPSTLERDEQLAFWVNTYNANVLAIVAAHTVSSIVEIPKVFTGLKVAAGGESLTLDEIEHAKVRRFGDFRIHHALNCASVGCPPLRAYEATGLDEQFDSNGRRYLANEQRGARLDGDRVQLSMVFRWFAGDFAPVGQMPSARGTLISSIRPARVLPAARRHLPGALQEARSIGFIPWDWTMNSAAT